MALYHPPRLQVQLVPLLLVYQVRQVVLLGLQDPLVLQVLQVRRDPVLPLLPVFPVDPVRRLVLAHHLDPLDLDHPLDPPVLGRRAVLRVHPDQLYSIRRHPVCLEFPVGLVLQVFPVVPQFRVAQWVRAVRLHAHLVL